VFVFSFRNNFTLSDRKMTSANFFNGYVTEKPSSRVLNPPGGRSNNIFGHEEEKPAQQLTANQEARNNKAHQSGDTSIFGAGQRQQQTNSNFHENSAQNNNSKNRNARSGYNPITGQLYAEEDSERRAGQMHTLEAKQAADKPVEVVLVPAATKPAEEFVPKTIHTSTKVHQPPGGKSTALW
jgi:hypothetical protein